MPRLHIKSGPRAGERIEVDQEMVIGRVEADLTIDDAELSRRHLVVRPLDGALEVEDLGSTNGTFVEDARIQGPTRLASGAIVKLGTTVLEVEGVIAIQATRVSPVADVEATRVRKVPSEPTPVSSGPATADLAAAGAAPPTAEASAPPSPAPSPDIAAAAAPSPPPSPPAAASPTPPASAPPAERAREPRRAGAPTPTSTLGSFSPPSSRRGRGLASRSWVPVAFSFGTVIATAAALVIYFAAR